MWVQLSSCRSFLLQKKVGLISGVVENSPGRDEAVYRVVCTLSCMARANKALAAVKRDAVRRVTSAPIMTEPVRERAHSMNETLFQKMKYNILRQTKSPKTNRTSERASRTKTEGTMSMEKKRSGEIEDDEDACHVIAEAGDQEDIHRLWVFVIQMFEDACRYAQNASEEKTKTIEFSFAKAICALVEAHRLESRASSEPDIVVDLDKNRLSVGNYIKDWPCLQSKRLVRSLSFGVQKHNEVEMEAGGRASSSGRGEQLCSVHARMVRKSDTRFMEGVLRVTSSFFSLRIFDSKSGKKLHCKDECVESVSMLSTSPSARKAPSPSPLRHSSPSALRHHAHKRRSSHLASKEPLQCVLQLQEEERGDKYGSEYLQKDIYRIPLISVLALWTGQCKCSSNCTSQTLNVLTGDEEVCG